MKYVVTDDDVSLAWDVFLATDPTGDEMRDVLESFAQTLGEPVAVPDAITSHDAPEGMRDLSPFYSYMLGWNACREAMLATHHPTTEKGCDRD